MASYRQFLPVLVSTLYNSNRVVIFCRYINDNLGARCKYHLQLLGWYFTEPDQFYLVMEKAECNLLTALKQGLSWTRRKQVAVDVARGLEAIHGVQYVYQDLKPQNVMVNDLFSIDRFAYCISYGT